MSKLVAFLSCVLLSGVSPLVAQEKSLNLTTRFDDNLGLARASADVVEDVSLAADVSLAWHRQFNVRTSADFGASLSVEHHFRTDDWDGIQRFRQK
jgi:hypothetical protein